ncbi:MAG: SRPBCC domain-containing protein [Anaerolineae bacterium]
MKRDLRFERFYKHPPERVWRALTEPEAIAKWYMETDFKAEVGHRFYLQTDPGPGFDGKLYGEVLEVDAPRRLVYSFKGGFMRHDTRVTWTLTDQAGGTLLVLEHTGFTGLVDAGVVSFIIGYGWAKFLKNMPGALDVI